MLLDTSGGFPQCHDTAQINFAYLNYKDISVYKLPCLQYSDWLIKANMYHVQS